MGLSLRQALPNFGLRSTAESGQEKFGQEAANFLQNDFYVDDGLKSFTTPENAIDVIRNTQAMCAAANLRLHKFASNSKVVLEAMPVEDRSKDLKDLDLRHDTLPVQRSLGTYWCIESDTIGFRIELKDKPLTRRGILSTVVFVFPKVHHLSQAPWTCSSSRDGELPRRTYYSRRAFHILWYGRFRPLVH